MLAGLAGAAHHPPNWRAQHRAARRAHLRRVWLRPTPGSSVAARLPSKGDTGNRSELGLDSIGVHHGRHLRRVARVSINALAEWLRAGNHGLNVGCGTAPQMSWRYRPCAGTTTEDLAPCCMLFCPKKRTEKTKRPANRTIRKGLAAKLAVAKLAGRSHTQATDGAKRKS